MSKCDHLIIDHKSTPYLGRKNSIDFKKTSKYGQLVIKNFSTNFDHKTTYNFGRKNSMT